MSERNNNLNKEEEKKDSKYYKQLYTLHFFDFVSCDFEHPFSIDSKMPKVLTSSLSLSCKHKHLRTRFPYASVPIELRLHHPNFNMYLFNITQVLILTFTFIVLLLQKQCITFINSNIYNNYWSPGKICLKETII